MIPLTGGCHTDPARVVGRDSGGPRDEKRRKASTPMAIQSTRLSPVRTYDEIIELDDVHVACATDLSVGAKHPRMITLPLLGSQLLYF